MLDGLKCLQNFTYISIYHCKINFVKLKLYENYLTLKFPS